MNNEKLIDDIVAERHRNEKGTGHVNIKVDDDNWYRWNRLTKVMRMSLRRWKLLAVLHVHDKLQF